MPENEPTQRRFERMARMRAEEMERQLRRKRWLTMMSATLSLAVALVSSFAFVKFKALPDLFKSTASEAFIERVKSLDAEIGILRGQLAHMQSVSVIPTNLPPNLTTAVALAEVSLQVSNVTVRIKALEDAITSSPDKALAIPLMRKDLDIVQRMQVDERAAIKAELERLYDFNKWFFGLIATMALSTVGLAIANAFKGSKESKDDAKLEV